MVHRDNARPGVSIVTGQKTKDVPRLPSSVHLARSDYRLFRSLQNYPDHKSLSCLKN